MSESHTNSNSLNEETKRLIAAKRRQAIERRRQLERERLNTGLNTAADTPLTTPFITPSTTPFITPSTTPFTPLLTPINTTVTTTVNTGSTSTVSRMTSIKPMISMSDNASHSYPKQSPVKCPYSRNDSQSKSSTKPNAISKTNINTSIKLISASRFEIIMGYNSDVIFLFRKMNTKNYDIVTKKWSFDTSEYLNLIKEMKSLPNVNITITDKIPETLMLALRDAQKRATIQINLNVRLRSEFIDQLFPFQKDGVIFGVRNNGRCLIADEMGLGKTLQAIGLMQWYRSDWPLIIVCPSSLRYQWLESLKRWLPDMPSNNVLIVNNAKQGFSRVDITIISYELLQRMKSVFTNENQHFYNMAVFDESHYIKNDKALRTESAHLLAKSCPRVILLTGTPALSRPIELFAQLAIIDPKLFKSKHEFGVRYCEAKHECFKNQKRGHWTYKGAQNLDELRILLESTVMIRRLKKDVLNQLPKKTREMIILSLDHLNEKEKQTLANLAKRVRFTSKKDNRVTLLEWFAETASAKVVPVCEYLEDIIKKDIKFIVFGHHKEMMNGIARFLERKIINYIRIDGSTPPKLRQEACSEFQTKSEYKVALLSITATAVGINLTAASTVIFAEIYWNPGVLAQAEDRVHRIGQQENVRVIYLAARKSADDFIWPLISKKLDVLNKVGLSKDNFDEASFVLDIDPDQQLITEFLQSFDEMSANKILDPNI